MLALLSLAIIKPLISHLQYPTKTVPFLSEEHITQHPLRMCMLATTGMMMSVKTK